MGCVIVYVCSKRTTPRTIHPPRAEVAPIETCCKKNWLLTKFMLFNPILVKINNNNNRVNKLLVCHCYNQKCKEGHLYQTSFQHLDI